MAWDAGEGTTAQGMGGVVSVLPKPASHVMQRDHYVIPFGEMLGHEVTGALEGPCSVSE
jgi:hypothetical protein